MRAGVIAPALPVLGLRQRKGIPFGRVSSAACRVQAAYRLSSEGEQMTAQVLAKYGEPDGTVGGYRVWGDTALPFTRTKA